MALYGLSRFRAMNYAPKLLLMYRRSFYADITCQGRGYSFRDALARRTDIVTRLHGPAMSCRRPICSTCLDYGDVVDDTMHIHTHSKIDDAPMKPTAVIGQFAEVLLFHRRMA